MKVLLAAGASPIATVNLVFILSFPLISIFTYLALRYLGALRAVAVVLALSFALLPWHFARLEHLQLANYWIIPLGIVWLTYVVAIPRARQATENFPRLLRPFPVALICGLLVGLSDPYIAVFFVIIGLTGFLFRLRKSNSRREIFTRFVTLAAPIMMFSLQLVVTKMMSVGPAVGTGFARPLFNQLYYGGYWFSLFIDQSTSPVAQLFPNSTLKAFLLEHADMESNASYNLALALASALCALVLLYAILNPRTTKSSSDNDEALRIWSGLWLISVACFVMTGFGIIFGVLVTTQIRAWGRISIVCAGIALVVLALLLTTLWKRIACARSWPRRLASKSLILGFLAVLLLDSFGRPNPIPVETDTTLSLAAMVAQAKSRLPEDCAVMNLPLTGFPEGGPQGAMKPYDAFLPYLVSDGWRFSFGLVQNQVGAEWRKKLSAEPVVLVDEVRSLGFCALLLDSAGYTEPEKMGLELEGLLGRPVASAKNRWFLYTLGKVPLSDLGAGLVGPEILFGDGFAVETDPANKPSTRRIVSSRASIYVTNPSDKAVSVEARFTLDASKCVQSVGAVVTDGSSSQQEFEIPPRAIRQVSYNVNIDPMGSRELVITSEPTACESSDGSLSGTTVSGLTVVD
jgi:hypothetical protein